MDGWRLRAGREARHGRSLGFACFVGLLKNSWLLQCAEVQPEAERNGMLATLKTLRAVEANLDKLQQVHPIDPCSV